MNHVSYHIMPIFHFASPIYTPNTKIYYFNISDRLGRKGREGRRREGRKGEGKGGKEKGRREGEGERREGKGREGKGGKNEGKEGKGIKIKMKREIGQ